MRLLIALGAVVVLGASCADRSPKVDLYLMDAVREAAPELAAELEGAGFVRVTTEPGEADLILMLRDGAGLLRLQGPGPVMDRRDPAFVDTIDLDGSAPGALALVVGGRALAMATACGAPPNGRARIETLRATAAKLSAALAEAEPSSPLAEDLRTTIRQALFQVASETGDTADIRAIFAFEEGEAEAGRGLNARNRYTRSRAWYYYASARHLDADLSVEREIASAFSGFKDAQRPFRQDRDAGSNGWRSDQELVAARVRIGQLLHVIGDLRDDDALRSESSFAFTSAARYWFEATGSEAPFCYRLSVIGTNEPVCITRDAVTGGDPGVSQP